MAIAPSASGVVVAPDKKIKPEGLQSFNKNIVKTLLNMDLQQKSRFDFILSRTPLDEVTAPNLGSIGGIIGMGIDMYIGKVYVQKLTFKPTNDLVTDRVNGDEFVKDIEYPTGITLNFLDDEKGTCMRYLMDWFNDIYFPTSVTSTKKGYIFRDNQEGARRTGLLMMAGIRGKFPWTFPRITFYGMFPKSISDITVAQDEKDHMTYDVTFSVREVRTARIL